MIGFDPYKELSINYTATASEIKAAYRSLALKHHPDRNNGNSSDRFLRIKRAYEILSDPIAKRDIDNERDKHLWRQGSQANNEHQSFGGSDVLNTVRDAASWFAENFLQESQYEIDEEVERLCSSSVTSSPTKGITAKITISRSNIQKIKRSIEMGSFDADYFSDEVGKIIASLVRSKI